MVKNLSEKCRAVVIPMVLMLMVTILGFAAITVDVGLLYSTRIDLQRTADAASLAAAGAYVAAEDNAHGLLDAVTAAKLMATSNSIYDQNASFILEAADIQFGDFSTDTNTFILDNVSPNAVRVTTNRTSGHANGPLDLIFASIFGYGQADVSAEAISMMGTGTTLTNVIPLALRAPGFGPIDPDIVDANPGKDGPSSPSDGVSFAIGEQVTLFTFGKGKKSPVHLVLNTDGIPGEVDIGKVLRGEQTGIPVSAGEEFPVLGEGTGHGGLGGKLADRLDDGNPDNLIIIMPIVEEIVNGVGVYSSETTTAYNSRNAEGELDGHVRIVDFVAVHLDAVLEVSIPDPNDPQDNGKTIDIEILVGTIVQSATGGLAGDSSGVVAGVSAGILQLVR